MGPTQLPQRVLVAIVTVAAGAWRLWLGSRYYGWEESDYGNLAMTRGVLESGFVHYDMNHLPMYYGLSALVMAVVGDAVLATRLVAWVGGLVTVGGLTWLADRVFGRRIALLVAAFVLVQPELALYSASSLREPVYGAALVLMACALVSERLVLASICCGVAFLTRMDALIAVTPVLLVHALGRGPRLWRALAAIAPLALLALGWAAYCSVVHGTWAFWSHSIAVNVETGGAERHGLAWARDGAGISLALFFRTLPQHLGWMPWLGLFPALAFTPWRRHGPRRTLTLVGVLMLGFWLALGFAGQHAPEHNLYWKWLYGVLPFVVVLGVWGVVGALDRTSRVTGRMATSAVLAALVAATLVPQLRETERQIEVSETLYRPQLQLAQLIEQTIDEDVVLLVDNIPGCWLDRRDHGRELWTWFDVPVGPNDREAFGAWLVEEQVGYVLWFAEEWTQAPVIAPWLEDVRPHQLGPVVLTPLRSDEAYGWAFYSVHAE